MLWEDFDWLSGHRALLLVRSLLLISYLFIEIWAPLSEVRKIKGMVLITRKLLALVPLFILCEPAIALPTTKVISIGDGDTLRVSNDSGVVKTIRLGCIDSPEMTQSPHGQESRKRLQQLIPVGTAIAYKAQGNDRYGRTVAEIFRGALNVNLALVQEGRAVAYRQYLSQCDRDQYLKAESSAKSRRLAFWSQDNPIMPWDFRRGVRAKTVKPWVNPPVKRKVSSNSKCDRSYPDVCIPPGPPDLNCADISYRRFRVVGRDPHRFDGDRDGIGCEG